MKVEQTLTIIKPDALEKKLQGKIINDILNAGFNIKAMKMLQLSERQARKFYALHKGKDFFEPLTLFMCSGPIITLLLEKENAVGDYRKLMGKTDPAKAEAGSLRAKYGETIRRNAVHGADSADNAKKEIAFFF